MAKKWHEMTWKELAEDTKKLPIKEKKKLAALIQEIYTTPRKVLLQQVKEEDLREKKSLIEMIDTFKKLHQKDIVNSLTEELEKVNKRIENLKLILK